MVQHRELIRAATAILAAYGVPAEIEAEEADARDRVADALITLRARSERHLYEVV